MLDEIRNPDPGPTEEEKDWMGLEPLGAIARAVALAAVALVVAWSTSVTLDEGGRQPLAVFGPR